MSATGFVPFAVRPVADATPLSLPARAAVPPRPSIPWLASAVPVVGALGFWALTGSVFALWFALLGPLIAVAGVLDGVRTGRRARREAEVEAAAARARLRARVDERHARERAELSAQHPDVAGYLSRREGIWRSVPDRDGVLVIGRGDVPSSTRVATAADAHPDDAALAAAAHVVSAAPVTLPLGAGVAVVGPAALARSVVRALVLQLALAHPPGSVELVAEGRRDAHEPWLDALPHAHAPAPVRIVLGDVGDAFAAGESAIVTAAPGDPLPPRFGTVLTLTGVGTARAEAGADVREVQVESAGATQASAIAAELSARWRAAGPRLADGSRTVALSALRAPARRDDRGSLTVAVGTGGGRAFEVDLVRDGPHAVVTGMTGAGKSELLVTWVVALCTAYPTSAVSFLLADFKGGTAFDALTALPHVTGVITDLDTRAARRAIESLRAEVRHREAVLARAGARDVADVDLPRLVVVVDEFAALRDAHPELETLFADLAARGRALGIHLVLGTQRAAGVLRDALLANCPLRISLRVADRLDSRALLGVDDAAELPGGEADRGLALVRRSADTRPARVRIALTSSADIAAAGRDAGAAPRTPWLPELPALVELDALLDGEPGLVAGLRDEPRHQRQPPWRIGDAERGVLAVGGPGAGKTTFLRALAAQLAPRRQTWVGPDPEQAWDAVAAGLSAPDGGAVFVDDLDALLARFPDEHARGFLDALERGVREAGRRGIRVFATTSRLSGPAGRIADLFPRRLILATASRADHVAAGGDARDHLADATPGRGTVDGDAVQVAFTRERPARPAPSAPLWEAPAGVAGFVTRAAPEAALALWAQTGVRLRSVDEHADPADAEPGGRVVVIGTPEQWLSHPRLLERIRGSHALLIDVGCRREARLLVADASEPPYAEQGRGRAWEYRAGARPRRVSVDPLTGT